MPVTKLDSVWNHPGYEGSLTFRRRDTGALVMAITEGGPIFPNPSGGMDYFVDGNTNNSVKDGASWATAFAVLAEALAASHARIATSAYRSWATRNRIFVIGDAIEEDLTKLAQKTDVIGLGQCDGFGPGARIKGNHVIGSTSYAGCRLFNLALHDNDASGLILTIPTQQSGIELINCDILAGASTVTGVLVTASAYFAMRRCRSFGSWDSGFSTAVVSVGAGTGHGTVIEDCVLGNTHATGVGILANIARAGAESFIRRCHIVATGLTIDDNSDTFYVLENMLVSGGAVGATSHDLNAAKAAGNILTGSDKTVTLPFATIA